MPYVLFQSHIRIGLWRIIIMTIVIVSHYKLPCTVCMCVFVCLLAILDSVRTIWSHKNSWTTKYTFYNQRSLSFFWIFFSHSINCPQYVKLYFSVGCRKVNDRHAVCPPKQRLSAALRTWSISVFFFFFLLPCNCVAKICDQK